jgi:hypothetical protein
MRHRKKENVFLMRVFLKFHTNSFAHTHHVKLPGESTNYLWFWWDWPIIKSQEVTRNHEIHEDEDNWSAGSYTIGSCEQINCMKMF